MNEERFDWEVQIITMGGSTKILHGCLSDLTKREAEEEIELMKRHGVLAEGIDVPPYEIYSIHLDEAENQDDDQG